MSVSYCGSPFILSRSLFKLFIFSFNTTYLLPEVRLQISISCMCHFSHYISLFSRCIYVSVDTTYLSLAAVWVTFSRHVSLFSRCICFS